MDPSSVASTPFFGFEIRLLTYIRPLPAASSYRCRAIMGFPLGRPHHGSRPWISSVQEDRSLLIPSSRLCPGLFRLGQAHRCRDCRPLANCFASPTVATSAVATIATQSLLPWLPDPRRNQSDFTICSFVIHASKSATTLSRCRNMRAQAVQHLQPDRNRRNAPILGRTNPYSATRRGLLPFALRWLLSQSAPGVRRVLPSIVFTATKRCSAVIASIASASLASSCFYIRLHELRNQLHRISCACNARAQWRATTAPFITPGSTVQQYLDPVRCVNFRATSPSTSVDPGPWNNASAKSTPTRISFMVTSSTGR